MEHAQKLALCNIHDLIPMLAWNAAHGIRCMRLSSEMFPHINDPAVEPYDLSFAHDALRRVGDMGMYAMYVWMYVYVCMYVCMYVYVCICVWKSCTYVCMYVCMFVCVCVARAINTRITFHPSHYTQIGAQDTHVYTQSVRDLTHHADVMDAMRVDKQGVIIVHGGGVYGDREETMERWVSTCHVMCCVM